MPEPTNPTNGAAEVEPKPSLREIAEASYDEVIDAAEASESEEQPDEARPRDERGRFVSRETETGEAAAPEPPSPGTEVPEVEEPHPAPETGQAAQPPANWSAEDRANFEKLTPEGQQFLLRRHSEMEGDYQRKVQASAVSNQFVQAIAPVFSDPVIAESLRANGRTPLEAVYQWAGFHKRAVSPELRDRVEVLFDMARQMQIDPAAVFGLSATPAGFTQEELANPANKKFAEVLGQTSTRIQALESYISQVNQAQQEAMAAARRAEIDAFADQKNADGSPAHPLFDHMIPVIMAHYQANPSGGVAGAYESAMKGVRETFTTQARQQIDQQQNVRRAEAAVRSNVRGMTAPVSKPAPPEGKRGLRQVLEESAEEIGW